MARAQQSLTSSPFPAEDAAKQREAVEAYSALIKRLPVPNKYLLLYVLDLLSVFEKKSDKNLMTATSKHLDALIHAS